MLFGGGPFAQADCEGSCAGVFADAVEALLILEPRKGDDRRMIKERDVERRHGETEWRRTNFDGQIVGKRTIDLSRVVVVERDLPAGGEQS